MAKLKVPGYSDVINEVGVTSWWRPKWKPREVCDERPSNGSHCSPAYTTLTKAPTVTTHALSGIKTVGTLLSLTVATHPTLNKILNVMSIGS